MKTKFCKAICFIVLVTTFLLAGIASAAAVNYAWTGDIDEYWKTANNWSPVGPPPADSIDVFLNDQTNGSLIVIDPPTAGFVGDDLYGPEFGITLDIIGGSLEVAGFVMAPVGTTGGAGRSIINMSQGAQLNVQNLLLGDNWWFVAPYVTMNMYDATTTAYVSDYVWLGGMLNIYDGTMDVTNGFNMAASLEAIQGFGSGLTKLDIWDGTLIVRANLTEQNVLDWIDIGYLKAYGYTPGGPEGSDINIDTTTIPGGVIITASYGQKPALHYPLNVENIMWDQVRLEWDPPADYTPTSYNIYLDPNEIQVALGSAATITLELEVTGDTDPNYPNVGYLPDLQHGTRYYWMVEAVNGGTVASGIGTFTTMPDAPIITLQPAPQTVAAGDPVTLEVAATNATDYKWYKDDVLQTGETDPTLNIAAMAIGNEGYYHCNVSNASTPAGIDSNKVRVMKQRRVALWTFDGSSMDSVVVGEEDAYTGTYFDPNTNDGVTSVPVFSSATPSPAGGEYMVFSGDTATSQGNNTGEAVLASDPDSLNFYPQGLTVSCWVQLTGRDGEWTGIVSKEQRNIPDPLGWALLNDPTNTAVFAARETTSEWADTFGTSDISAVNPDTGDNWHLVTGTYDGSVSSIYVDGNLETVSAASTVVMQTHPDALAIGAETADGFAPLDGLIDNVEIYNYALSRYDVAKLYTDLVTGADVCIQDASTTDMDFNDDCQVNLEDFADFASSWLDCYLVPTCIP